MVNNNFEDIKVNYIDSKLSQSYKEIAEINAKALNNELNLSADDYALMVSRQADKIRTLQSSNELLEEENRKLKVQIKKMS